MRKKNTVVIKQRDEWSGLAQFLGDMIAKYAEDMDFKSLPDPDKYGTMNNGRRAMIISERIFKIIKEKNITQAEFAKRVGIATSAVSEWKKKKTNPSADKIMDICVALEVTPEELLTGRGIDEENGFTEMESKDRLTPVDWQIIDDFHGMKEAQKRRLLKYMEALKQLEELEELV